MQLELATERERVYGITEVKSKLESELDSERRAVQELSSNLKDVDNRLRLLDQEASEKLKTQQKQNRKLKKELTKQMWVNMSDQVFSSAVECLCSIGQVVMSCATW